MDSIDLKSAETECESHQLQIFQIKNDLNAVSLTGPRGPRCDSLY